MKNISTQLKNRWAVAVIALGIGLVVGMLPTSLHDFFASGFSNGSGFNHERVEGDYRFVSPLLSCGEEKFDHVSNEELRNLEKELTTYIDRAKAAGEVNTVAMYFRQLKGGPWLGINEDQEFVPASLLKVPLAMAIYKKAESNPNILSSTIFYEKGDSSHMQYFKNYHVTPGETYFVEELIDSTLIHSDNNAAELLASALSDREFQDAYRTFGIDPPNRAGEYSTNVHYYASFFRILWNATYLSSNASEELLETMSRSTFTRGLVAGVPPGTVVSHKFGERSAVDTDLVQLHDCGIVYHPDRPYLICIMTQGKDWDALTKVLVDTSRIVWKSVD